VQQRLVSGELCRMKHNRRSIRLKEYDYAASGEYFITICTYEHQCLFGEIVGANGCSPDIGGSPNIDYSPDMILNEYGKIVQYEWRESAMKPKSISSFIAGYKSIVTKRINQIRNTHGQPVWQRNYYEHIIRDDKDLNRIREYIVNNPAKWEEDDYYESLY